jgi:flagellar assembly factor FliW
MSMSFQSPNFGTIEYTDEDVVHLVGGMPGFKDLSRFLLIEGSDLEPFKFLQSVEEPAICFPLIDPRGVRSGYQLKLGAEQRQELGLVDSKEGLVFSIVTVSEDPAQSTVNLFAPLVINTSNMRGAQVLMMESDYSVQEPLVKV